MHSLPPSLSTHSLSTHSLPLIVLAASQISLDVKPKDFTCVCFVPSPGGSCDVLVGGSNGYIFLFRRGRLASTRIAHALHTPCVTAAAAVLINIEER
jgi:hypothetical protein